MKTSIYFIIFILLISSANALTTQWIGNQSGNNRYYLINVLDVCLTSGTCLSNVSGVSSGGNTTTQIRNAINNSGYYNISVNASNVLNTPWITTDTDTWNTTTQMRSAVNNSGYYNITINTTSNMTIGKTLYLADTINASYVSITAGINSDLEKSITLRTSQSADFFLGSGGFFNIYNSSGSWQAYISSAGGYINTRTTGGSSNWYSGYLLALSLNASNVSTNARIDALNLSKGNASTGNCAVGQGVQNITTTGVQCFTPAGATYTAGNGLILTATQFNVSATTCQSGNYSYYNGTGFQCSPDQSGGTVPYQTTAAGWTNNTANTYTVKQTIIYGGDDTTYPLTIDNTNQNRTNNPAFRVMLSSNTSDYKAFQLGRTGEGIAWASFEDSGSTQGLYLGDGSSSRDVNIYRSGANMLRTDDNFTAVGIFANINASYIQNAPWITSYTDTWNTTTQMRSAVNNSGYYNISLNASNVLNAPWVTTDTDTWNTTTQMRTAVNNSGYYNITVNYSNILNHPAITGFTYSDWFNQKLNTTDDVRFNRINTTNVSGWITLNGQNITFFNTSNSGDTKLYITDGSTLRSSKGMTISGTTYIGGSIESSSDIYTTGSGDDLWLGTNTQTSSKARIYANGTAYLDELRINGTTTIVNADIVTDDITANDVITSNLTVLSPPAETPAGNIFLTYWAGNYSIARTFNASAEPSLIRTVATTQEINGTLNINGALTVNGSAIAGGECTNCLNLTGGTMTGNIGFSQGLNTAILNSTSLWMYNIGSDTLYLGDFSTGLMGYTDANAEFLTLKASGAPNKHLVIGPHSNKNLVLGTADTTFMTMNIAGINITREINSTSSIKATTFYGNVSSSYINSTNLVTTNATITNMVANMTVPQCWTIISPTMNVSIGC